MIKEVMIKAVSEKETIYNENDENKEIDEKFPTIFLKQTLEIIAQNKEISHYDLAKVIGICYPKQTRTDNFIVAHEIFHSINKDIKHCKVCKYIRDMMYVNLPDDFGTHHYKFSIEEIIIYLKKCWENLETHKEMVHEIFMLKNYYVQNPYQRKNPFSVCQFDHYRLWKKFYDLKEFETLPTLILVIIIDMLADSGFLNPYYNSGNIRVSNIPGEILID